MFLASSPNGEDRNFKHLHLTVKIAVSLASSPDGEDRMLLLPIGPDFNTSQSRPLPLPLSWPWSKV